MNSETKRLSFSIPFSVIERSVAIVIGSEGIEIGEWVNKEIVVAKRLYKKMPMLPPSKRLANYVTQQCKTLPRFSP